MQFENTAIAGVIIIRPKRHQDARGFFSEIARDDLFKANGITGSFVQENVSRSTQPGTLRGLHYQLPPKAQGKLVRATYGAILDVAVDIRTSSPTFGKHVAIELSADNGTLLYVPPGCAHGFVTLVPNTEVNYKVTDYWSAEHERGLLWNDPALGIAWSFSTAQVTITPRDAGYPSLADLTDTFV
jgi:dTDP-4-dehydrorhamnose 3,5-epimerase